MQNVDYSLIFTVYMMDICMLLADVGVDEYTCIGEPKKINSSSG